MIKKRIISIKHELKSFCYRDKIFIFSVMASIFFISFEFSITRPASESLFLHYYGSKFFPHALLLTVPINFATVACYNYLLPRIGCIKMWISASILTVIINLGISFYDSISLFCFLQFIWKDIYILLMYKQIWSLILISISYNKAKYLYGIIFSMGGLGSIIGGLIPGFFASKLGTEKLFLFTFPIYFVLGLLYLSAYKNSNFSGSLEKEDSLFSFLKNSKYIIFVLLTVVFMQISIALIHYQYNQTLENSIIGIDQRTEYTGKMFTIVHVIMTVLQLIGGVIIVNFLGLKKTHYLIPITLVFNAVLLIFRPTLAIASYVFIYIKSMDYSIFGIIKEMLYLPMKVEQKFKTKALIDIFAFRTAKAFAAFFLLFMGFYKAQNVLSFFSILIFIIWIFIIRSLFKRYYLFEEIII